MTTYDQLKDILVNDYEVPPAKLAPSARLDELGIDSLGVMELMFKIEEAFDIRLPPEEVALDTVQDVVDHIEKLSQDRQHPLGAESGVIG